MIRPQRALIAEVLAYPGVPAQWRSADLAASLLPVIPIRFERDGRRFGYFSTIECFFPLDDETRRQAEQLSRSL